MKITVEEDPQLKEAEVLVRCPPGDPEAGRILAALTAAAPEVLTGWREGQAYRLNPRDVLYGEAVDGRTFLYTAGAVYETPLRLYELERDLAGRGFLRASKSTVVNFAAVRSLRPDLGGRIRLTMEGGEAVYVSRQYAPVIKKKLGI